MIITIDGTSGAGKSTAGKNLARALRSTFLSSGEIYRAFAYILKENGIDAGDEHVILPIINKNTIEIRSENNIGVFFVNGKRLDAHFLHNPTISALSAKISPIKELRERARTLQRDFAANAKTAVVEGRDIGSVVFPNADVKFFITASLETRAQRRYLELKEAGNRISYNEVFASLKARDDADENRKYGKLVVPDGAVVIETTNLSIDGVLDTMLAHIPLSKE